jgi:carboxyl-terminal processing protease
MMPASRARIAARRLIALSAAAVLAAAAFAGAPSPSDAADASLVIAAVRIAVREYFRTLDPVALLNAAVASLRSRSRLEAGALPDIPPGTWEDDAVRQFTAEFARAESAASAPEPEFAYAVTREMLSSLHDSHMRFMAPEQYAEFKDTIAGRESYAGIGVRTVFPADADGPFVTDVAPGSPAAGAGIRRFDQILTADGVAFKGGSATDVAARLRGAAGSSVILRIRRGGETIEVAVTRAMVQSLPVGVHMIRPGIVYVRVWSFSRGTALAVRHMLQAVGDPRDIHAIVLDLRGNPGGLVGEAEWVAGLFVPAGTVLARTHWTAGSGTFAASGDTPYPETPLALLVDGGSASGAEILTIGLRDARRAVVVGQTTTGAFGGARDFALPEGGMLVTTLALTGPRGEAVEGHGITPDEVVSLTAEDMLRGDDPQLAAALAAFAAVSPAAILLVAA